MQQLAQLFQQPADLPICNEEQTVPEHLHGAIQHLLATYRNEDERHSTQAARHWEEVSRVAWQQITLRNTATLLLFLSCTYFAPRTLLLTSCPSILLFRLTGETGTECAQWLRQLPQETKDMWLKLGLIAATAVVCVKNPTSSSLLSILLSSACGLAVGHRFLFDPN